MAIRHRDGTAAPLSDEPEPRARSWVESSAFGAWAPSDERLDAYAHQALAFVVEGHWVAPRPWAAAIFWHIERCEECAALFEAAAAENARRAR